MLVFAAEFPAAASASLDALIDCCRAWIVGSPHYPWKNAADLTVGQDLIAEHEKEGVRVSLSRTLLGDSSELAGAQLVWVENSQNRWTTEIVGRKDASALWISVQLFCELLTPGLKMPVPQKPYFFKNLFERLGGGQDGELVVSDKPHLLKENDVELAARIVEGRADNSLPVAYVSATFLNHHAIDAKKLARWMSALCHVVVEPSRQFSRKLATKVNSRNVYGGAVGLYWPASAGRHTRLMPTDFRDQKDLEAEIQRLIRFALASVRSKRSISWAELREAISRKRVEELKAKGDSSLNDYVAAFDTEIEALRTGREDLRRENEWLSEAVRKLQEARPGIVALGTEQELYAGEILDVVLAALRDSQGHTLQGSRRQTIIEDLLGANESTGRAAEIEAGIKAILSQTDRIGASQLEEFRKLGFTVEDGGKHYKAIFGGDPRLSFTLFKTASDHRSGKNLASDIIKKLLK